MVDKLSKCTYYEDDGFNEKFRCSASDFFGVLHINIRSVNKNLDEFILFVDRLEVEFSVIVLTETWLNPNMKWVDVPGFVSYHSVRTSGRGGGVTILVRSDVESSICSTLNQVSHIYESCAVIVDCNGGKYLIMGVYRPPESNIDDFKYVNIADASRFTDRVNTYNSNQISFQNNEFLIDENTDGVSDYSFDNPDFSFVQLQTNLVARWEYIPGSELFLVWARGSVGSADPADDLTSSVYDQVFNAPANDTFLIKLTYRFVR